MTPITREPGSSFVPLSVSAAGEHSEPMPVRPLTEQEEIYDQVLRRWVGSRYVDYPHQIGIETLAVCNASCDFCAYTWMERRGDRMPDALIAKIFDDMDDIPSDLPFELSFSRVNDPFIDKRFFDIAAEANRRFPQARLWLFTNASPLVPQLSAKLPELRQVDQFVISFNDHRPREYERVMGLPFDRTVAIVDRIHAMVEAGELDFTPVISRVGDGTDADRAFLEWTARRWPRFPSRSTHRFSWFGQTDIVVHGDVPRAACHQWFHLPILASGRVTYCRIDHEGSHSYGDVSERHLLEIYNRPDRRRLRVSAPDRADVDVCRSFNHLG